MDVGIFGEIFYLILVSSISSRAPFAPDPTNYLPNLMLSAPLRFISNFIPIPLPGSFAPPNYHRFAVALGCLVTALCSKHSLASEPIEFNRDIRPILSDACFACHGPDPHARQADLRLDDRESAIASGAITPGKLDASSILQRIVSTDPDLVMPPPKTGKSISPEQREKLKQWILQGAIYQPHWAFVPVAKQITVPNLSRESLAKIPALKNDANATYDAWNPSPIDRFVLDKMVSQGLAPAPQTDPLTWLRRVSLDLTGLPPTLPMLEAILADPSESNRSVLVDQLLNSDAYGQRMANLWLDVARYADTFGYQSDVNMDVWPWRDWVIDAFSKNLPYDQFVTWQLAGDLLPNATQEQKLATAFNRLHRQTNEGGSIEEEFRQVYIADRTVTAGTAFLGLTLECSRCHDHKYDPIAQKDFYSLAAYFADIDEHGLYSHFTRATPTPSLTLYTPEQSQKHKELLAEILRLEKAQDQWVLQNKELKSTATTVPPTATWEFPLDGTEPGVAGNATKFNGDDAASFPLNIPHPSEQGKTLQVQLGRETPFSFSLWVKPDHHAPRVVVAHTSVAAEDAAFRGMQLVLEQGKPQFSLIHFWPGDAIRVEASQAIPVQTWTHLAVCYDGSSRASGVRVYVNGLPVPLSILRDQLTRDFRYRAQWGDSNAGSVQFSLGARFRDVGFRDGLMDDLKVFDYELATPEVIQLFVSSAPGLTPARRDELLAQANKHWESALLRGQADFDHLTKELTEKRREENELIASVRTVMTMAPAIVRRPMHVLQRGAYDAPGEAVEASPLMRLTESWKRGDSETKPTRLELARWIVSEENPLTSRVAVNRWWSVFFGRGIVASLEDFGSQGAVPTHPELLDWLTRDFVSNGWDLKRFCKQIVLSATYRQSSVPRDASWELIDPENKYLFHGPRHRLSAEQVRDAALAVSGLLIDKVGGPSVMPYQPPGVWEEAGTGKSYSQAKGEGLYRRSMYTFWRRTAPPPSMLAFDATSRETCTARRETTTTPLQALVLLNDPQYIEAARNVAQLVMQGQGQEEIGKRFEQLALRILNRPLTSTEVSVLQDAYREQREYFASHPQATQEYLGIGDTKRDTKLDSVDHAAMSVVAGMLMCFDDFIMKR